MSADTRVKVALVVPTIDEFEAVRSVWSIDTTRPLSLPQGGTYYQVDLPVSPPLQPCGVAISCMNGMYNFESLVIAERLLANTKPDHVFLVGSACGRIGKVEVGDVVVSTESIAYLGRGRRFDQSVNPRPHTVQISRRTKDALTHHLTKGPEFFYRWKRQCCRAIRESCGKPAEEEFVSSGRAFEVKAGIIASDDLVLTFTDHEAAEKFWREFREDAKAYDMESAGFAHACDGTLGERTWAVVRGISDHGIEGEVKYHRAAATVAACWLKGFLTDTLLSGRTGKPASVSGVPTELAGYDWKRLFDLIMESRQNTRFLGKGRFITQVLLGDFRDIQALTYAIACGAIREFEASTKPGRSTTAIRLVKTHPLWVEFSPPL